MKRRKSVKHKAAVGAGYSKAPTKNAGSDPSLFSEIQDVKKSHPLLIPECIQKMHSSNQFSIITAVYNVELYLNDFFESLIHQTIEFQNSIEIILVDDGSVDKSSDIIKQWVSRYPDRKSVG